MSEPTLFWQKYDQFFLVNFADDPSLKFKHTCPSNAKKLRRSAGPEDNEKRDVLLSKIAELLKKGLGSRILSLEFEWRKSDASWEVAVFGMLINPDSYNTPIDKGPSADKPQAVEYREFWGEKSEMRKFADSSICETVVWQGETESQKRSILSQIIKFILNRHFQIKSERIHFVVDPFDVVLSTSRLKASGEEEFLSLRDVYERLTQAIRLLDDLPLAVTRVFSPETALRQTEIVPVFPVVPTLSKTFVFKHNFWTVPRPNGLFAPPWCPSLEVQITLESSSKWTDEVKVIRYLKTAFYLKIAELLRRNFRMFTTAQEDCALVFLNGYVFRLVIVYVREVTLLKTQITDAGVIKRKDNEASASLDKNINHRPKLCTYLSGIVQQFPSFPLTCRLAKRWICSQMFSGYICDEAVELLVAQVYLSPKQFTVPGSSAAGFIRFLSLLTTFDWLQKPLIVNLNNQLTKEDITEIQANFVKLRPTLPPMCIVTPDDLGGSIWTRPQPNAMIVERLIYLAESTFNELEQNFLVFNSQFDPKSIFRPPLDVYDALIHLDERQMPRRFMSFDFEETEMYENKKRTKKNADENCKVFPVIDYDPVQLFVGDLNATFNDAAMFFYDNCGGVVIGVLWKPEISSLEDNTISPSSKKKQTKTRNNSREKILENIKILGKGLVKNIDVR